ncbi:hypothetical protein IAR55_002603 [Kwoniella newhampshirensis]|uniref:Carboxylesterase type B domain-containing protein n=1 Tax=Kwoniella newhampshirensis TaxID=1651941 RepID=A0AAW0YSB7_9TREE
MFSQIANALLVGLCAVPLASAHPLDSTTPVVSTIAGPVQGFVEESTGHHVFLGIRYAESTDGDNRWRPPQPLEHHASIYNASHFAPACPQFPPPATNPYGISEDCLSVNVWAPAQAKKLPVLIYNYGGAMVQGTNADPTYNGSAFASSGFVYVSLQHRSGLMGFPYGKIFNGTSQNFGILDAFEAVHWVEKNIHDITAFGGDPEHITFMGQSSGGVMVDHYLWNHPKTKIKAAIIQSADVFSGPGYAPEQVGFDVLAGEMNCPADDLSAQLSCLRNVTIDRIFTANFSDQETWFVPVIDEYTRFSDYETRFKAGRYPKHVPVLTGSANNEETLFGLVVYPPSQTTPFSHWINTFNADAAHIPDDLLLSHYPDKDFPSSALQSGKLYANLRFFCAIDYLIDLRAELGNHYRYRFMGNYSSQTGYPAFGACHGCELPYIFKTYNRTLATGIQPELSNKLHKIWADFAKNPSEGPGWNATTAHDGPMALFGSSDAPLDTVIVQSSEYNGICQNVRASTQGLVKSGTDLSPVPQLLAAVLSQADRPKESWSLLIIDHFVQKSKSISSAVRQVCTARHAG